MPYRSGTYDFVVNNSFKPFSMQEMLAPLAMYKEAFEKADEAYTALQEKADDFSYLAEKLKDSPDSKAANIYKKYADDLHRQAKDLQKNGLSMGNRGALSSLRRRYSGEIGRLVKAQTRLEKEADLRRQMNAKDPSMLWAVDNLNIDDYLDNETPNLYGISGTELYSKAAVASQAISKRQFSANGESKTLGGYYRDFVQQMGYTSEQLRQFGDQISQNFASWATSKIPELGRAANQILEANGVTENFKNNPVALRKAQLQVIRGLIDGAVYTENHSPQRDLGVPTWAEQRNAFESDRDYAYKLALLQTKNKELELKAGKGGKSGSGSGGGYGTLMNGHGVRLEWNGDTPKDTNGEDDDNVSAMPLGADTEYVSGKAVSYDELPTYMKNKVDRIVGDRGLVTDYTYYIRPYKSGGLWGMLNDTEAALDIVPNGIKKGTGPGYDIDTSWSLTGDSSDEDDDE